MELKACFVDGVEFINSDLFPNLLQSERESSGFFVETLEQMVNVVWSPSAPENKDSYFSSELAEKSLSKNANLTIFKDFLLNVLLCNEVIVTRNKGNGTARKFVFQSLSPDEVAFIEAMDTSGVSLSFCSDTEKRVIVTSKEGSITNMKFKIHGSLSFTADRKRMSFVIEETNGKIKLLSKGADSKVFTFLNSADKLTQDMLKATNKNLTNFASQGNRTLVFAAKTLDENEFKEWKEAYDNATVLQLKIVSCILKSQNLIFYSIARWCS
jgi:magnesium-transporting ATPase (P-type)